MACPRTGAGCSEKCDAGRWVLLKSSQTAASTRTWQRLQMCVFCEGLTQSLVAMCVFSICSWKPQGINSRPKKKGLVFHHSTCNTHLFSHYVIDFLPYDFPFAVRQRWWRLSQPSWAEGTLQPWKAASSVQACTAANYFSMRVFGLWDEVGVSGENPHRRRKEHCNSTQWGTKSDYSRKPLCGKMWLKYLPTNYTASKHTLTFVVVGSRLKQTSMTPGGGRRKRVQKMDEWRNLVME